MKFRALSYSVILGIPINTVYSPFTGALETSQKWSLIYEEDFSTSLKDSDASWRLEDYSEPLDTILDDNGKFFHNDYGPDFANALDSFHTYRKEFQIGKDGWLTASLSARDWNKDGKIEREPHLSVVKMDGSEKMALRMDASHDHTGGVILRNTKPLPDEYRIEYKLMTLDFGGKRDGKINYDGKVNGYTTKGPIHPCKTQHPWGEGSGSKGWSGHANSSYCEWQNVVSDVYGYNGFSFISIVDFPDPSPRNNHFWHFRRKVLIDSFAQHPDRVGKDSGGQVCNSDTNEYYDYRDSDFNVVNMWISGLPGTYEPKPGGLTGNSQRFMTTCNDGKATRGLQSAAELLPEIMPYQYYKFAIERNTTGYTLEVSGNFARVGFKTIRLYRQFDVDGEPIWHFNTNAEDYDGRYNFDLKQLNWDHGSSIWQDQWPKGSAYPDSFVIGDLYTNAYEGVASLTDIRYFEPFKEDPCKRAILLTSKDKIVMSGERLMSSSRNVYIDQQNNANLQLWRIGSVVGKDELVWENGLNEPTNATYYTELQNDGRLVTFSLNGENRTRSILWMTDRNGPSNRTYSLTVDCEERGGNLAIFSGPPQTNLKPLWRAVVEMQEPTPLPTMSQVSSYHPDGGIECSPTILMKSGDFLYSEKRMTAYDRNFHFIQLQNGNVEIRWGSPEIPGDLIWESGYRGDLENSYFTKLETNGNLITWKTEQNHTFSPVWETSIFRPNLAVHYLVVECSMKNDSVALYEGHPNHGGIVVWSAYPLSDGDAQMPISKPTLPYTSNPSMSPTTTIPTLSDKITNTETQEPTNAPTNLNPGESVNVSKSPTSQPESSSARPAVSISFVPLVQFILPALCFVYTLYQDIS